MESVKVIKQAISEAGGNEDLVGCISMPTMQATESLMRHPNVALILATGGAAMVRAAYSSGNPAIGVGPGNGPSFIERSADIKEAVAQIVASKTFDNGTICASEQSVICTDDYRGDVRAEMERQGCYFLDDAERAQLGRYILRANGTMNPEIVGRSAQAIAKLAGLTIPDGTKIIVAPEDGVGYGHPYSNEKLAQILAFYSATDYKAVCEKCEERGDTSLRGSGAYLLHPLAERGDRLLLLGARPSLAHRRERGQHAGRDRRDDRSGTGADPRLRRGGLQFDLGQRRAAEPDKPASRRLSAADAGGGARLDARLPRRHLRKRHRGAGAV